MRSKIYQVYTGKTCVDYADESFAVVTEEFMAELDFVLGEFQKLHDIEQQCQFGNENLDYYTLECEGIWSTIADWTKKNWNKLTSKIKALWNKLMGKKKEVEKTKKKLDDAKAKASKGSKEANQAAKTADNVAGAATAEVKKLQGEYDKLVKEEAALREQYEAAIKAFKETDKNNRATAKATMKEIGMKHEKATADRVRKEFELKKAIKKPGGGSNKTLDDVKKTLQGEHTGALKW